ncbi:MAG: hypothetical protein Q7T07_07215 [Burkholderiaceae bacterium]|nr:hypothetical protein [Burkholderiaceae bacterium]
MLAFILTGLVAALVEFMLLPGEEEAQPDNPATAAIASKSVAGSKDLVGKGLRADKTGIILCSFKGGC